MAGPVRNGMKGPTGDYAIDLANGWIQLRDSPAVAGAPQDGVFRSVSVGPNTPDPLIANGGWHIGNGYLIAPPPNGSDDTTVLNNILAAVPASGGEVLLQPGVYNTPAGGLTCANPVSIEGRGCGVGNLITPYWEAGNTTILTTTGNVAALTLAASGSRLGRLALLCTASPSAGGAGVVIPSGISYPAAGSGNRYIDLTIRGFNTNLDIQDGTEWFMDRCFMYDYGLYGVRVRNATSTDGGDMSILNSLIYGGPTNVHPSAGLRYEAGGGMRLIGNKFNYRGSSANGPDYCVELQIVDGANTGELYMAANGLSVAQIACVRLHDVATGVFAQIQIVGNNISPYAAAGRSIQIDPSSLGHISVVTIVGNTMKNATGSVYPISLTRASNVSIAGNVYTGPLNGCAMQVDAASRGICVNNGDLAGVGPTTDQPVVATAQSGSSYFDTTLFNTQFAVPNTIGSWMQSQTNRKQGLTYSTSITPSAAKTATWLAITATDGVAFTINAAAFAPDSGHTGELTFEVLNSSGGALGVISWNVIYNFAGQTWVNPANTKKRFARFEWSGTQWVCTGLSAADY